MKRIKISIVAIFAILCGFGLSSFTRPIPPKPFDVSWFLYNGGTMTDPSSYTYSSSVPTCAENTSLCAIHVSRNASTNEPDQAALTSLYNNNDQFKEPVDGVIKFKD